MLYHSSFYLRPRRLIRLQAAILQLNAAMPDEISLDLEADARVIRPDKIASSSLTIREENERKTYMDGAVCHSKWPTDVTSCREMEALSQ